jgi:predicted secreted protein
MRVFVLSALLVGLAACNVPEDPPTSAKIYPVEYNEAISVEDTGRFGLSLIENAGTGYVWRASVYGSAINVAGEEDAPGRVAAGAETTRVFWFDTVENGTATVTFALARAGEPPEQTRVIEVTVDAG